ncbi:MAG: hypothetical protein WCS30_13430 [Selenomonadaceae bacterium]
MVGRLLKLERIGDGSHRGKFTPYCKKVLGVYRNGFVKTEEMKPNRDYSNANSVGTRGVYDYYILAPGEVYEVMEVESWTRAAKYYLYVDHDGNLQKKSYEEALKCLSEGLISMF